VGDPKTTGPHIHKTPGESFSISPASVKKHINGKRKKENNLGWGGGWRGEKEKTGRARSSELSRSPLRSNFFVVREVIPGAPKKKRATRGSLVPVDSCAVMPSSQRGKFPRLGKKNKGEREGGRKRRTLAGRHMSRAGSAT